MRYLIEMVVITWLAGLALVVWATVWVLGKIIHAIPLIEFWPVG